MSGSPAAPSAFAASTADTLPLQPSVLVRPGLLVARALACRRGERLLFSSFGLAIAPSEVIWLRGSNGRGKTSLLRLLAGLATPEAGEILWDGQVLKSVRAAMVSRTLYLAHSNALKEDLTAVESLAFLARLHGQASTRDALLHAMSQLGIASRRDAAVRTLSQGQRRRVALSRLALEPRKALWLLDEPYDALDAEGCARVDEQIAMHVNAGGSVLLTSHLPLQFSDPPPRELHLEPDS